MKHFESNARSSVTACSALKKSYRDVLREQVPDAFFVFLDGPFEVVQARIDVEVTSSRLHHSSPLNLKHLNRSTMMSRGCESTSNWTLTKS